MKGKTYSHIHFLRNLIKSMSQGIVRRLSQQKEVASEYDDLELATQDPYGGRREQTPPS